MKFICEGMKFIFEGMNFIHEGMKFIFEGMKFIYMDNQPKNKANDLPRSFLLKYMIIDLVIKEIIILLITSLVKLCDKV